MRDFFFFLSKRYWLHWPSSWKKIGLALYLILNTKGFSRQEYWSGLPFPSPGDLPDSGIKPRSPAQQADALTSQPPGKPFKCMVKQ